MSIPRLQLSRLRAALVAAALLVSGCVSLSTHFGMINDEPRFGTRYPGSRVDLNVLSCYGRSVSRDATTLFLTPVAGFHLIDLPFSALGDTAFLAIDIPMDSGAPPLRPGSGFCRLYGMYGADDEPAPR